MPSIRLRYFAVLRDQAGRTEESLSTNATTCSGLYIKLAAKHGFRLAPEQVRVAINGEFARMTDALKDGDEIVFIPPVAGG